jgi:hypothetical protein
MKICLVVLDGSIDTEAAARWLRQQHVGAADFAAADVIWYHAATLRSLPPVEPPGRKCGVLCTGSAASLLHDWGWEPVAPAVSQQSRPELKVRTCGTEDALRGHIGLREHPIFAGLAGGVCSWQLSPDQTFTSVLYRHGHWPERARVVAVERNAEAIVPDCATIWEMPAPAGGNAVAIGAYIHPAADDAGLKKGHDRLLLNALAYCARSEPSNHFWPRPGSAVALRDAQLEPAHLPLLQGGLPDSADRASPALLPTSREPIAVRGRRVLVTGSADTGVTHVRVHPMCVLKDLQVSDFKATARRTGPGFLQRATSELVEQMFVPLELPAVVWQWRARGHVVLTLSWTVQLEPGWPFPEDALGSLHWNIGEQWLLVRTDHPRESVQYSFNRPVVWSVADGANGAPALRVRATAHLAAGESLIMALVASCADRDNIQATARALDRPALLEQSRAAAAQRIGQECVRLRTPFPDVNAAWHLAVQRLNDALSEAPALGRSFLGQHTGADCGFSSCEAVECAMAALALGDFQTARSVIEFLGRAQDPNGRVPDVCLTNGFTQYGDRVATPLFLLLIARFFAFSGDITFLRRTWQHVRLALVFCRSAPAHCDPDTLRAAMRELALTAEAIGEREDADRLRSESNPADGLTLSDPAGGWSAWNDRLDRAPYSQGFATQLGRCHTIDAQVRVLTTLLYGLLGIDPDAARQRIRLRPWIPGDWWFLEAAGLRFGDSRLALRYHRNDSAHTFQLVPLEGTIPLRIIFEPSVEARAITRITVDGVVATLDLRRADDRWICPVQVTLDHERTIVLTADDHQE